MSIFLVLTPVCAFVDPLTIIFGQPVEVDPESSRFISYNSLWSFKIYGYFIVSILNKNKSSCRVSISVKIIVLII
jgi:hypothetical protein